LGKDGEFVWTSINQWEWEKLSLPNGVRYAPFRGQVVPTDPVTATVTFNDKGISGALRSGPLKVDNDLLVVYSRNTPRLGVTFKQGKLSGGVGDILPKDSWILASPMTQEQQRRNAALLNAFNSSKTFPSRPTLAVWCKPTDLGFEFPHLKQRRGASLMLVPIEFRRPEPGTKVAIPSAFLDYSTTIGPDGLSRSAIYSSATGKWVDVQEKRVAWLRIQIPKSLVPLKVSQLDVVIHVQAPQRQLTILASNSSGIAELEKISSPNGVVKRELKKAEYLQLDSKGDLVVGLKIDRAAGDAGINAKVEPAKIESLQFILHGEIPSKSQPDSKQVKKKKS